MGKNVNTNRVISFLSQKGGVGKSSLASLLIHGLIKKKVEGITVVDADTAQSSLTSFFRRRETVLDKSENIKVVMGMGEKYAPYVSDEGYTVFDMPGMASKKTLAVAKLSTHIFLPVNPSLLTAEPQVVLANELVKHGVSSSKIAFVFTLSRQSSNVDAVKRYMNLYLQSKIAVLETDLPFQVAYEGAMNYGRFFSEVPFNNLREKACSLQEAMLNFIS